VNSDTTPSLGPVLTGTLVTSDFDACVASYVDHLSMRVVESGRLEAALAELWSASGLAGERYAVLGSETGVSWVRVIEDASIHPAIAFKQHGWMAMEVLVQDVDRLAMDLMGSPFVAIRPPANLDVSEDIRAMQVVGPAGEVLYLTQVKAEVPPFLIPVARCRVDHVFIPVMCCADREVALEFYDRFPNTRNFRFETTITSVNAAFGDDLDRRHPVAAVQLARKTMIEIDQIDAASARPSVDGRLPPGIALISCEVESLEIPGIEFLSQPAVLPGEPYRGRRSACCRGAGGELVELIERS